MRSTALALALLFTMIVTAADKPAKIFPIPYDIHDYPNGLRLVTVQTDYPNVVALYIVVQTGSHNEVEPGKSGFAHLFEHMMFRGTKQTPPEKYEAVMREAGAASNAYTTDDRTVYHTTFSKEDLEQMIGIEADRFQHLEYTPEQFKTETLAVLGEYNKNSSAPISKLSEVLRDTAFDKSTYKHTTMGFLQDVKNMPNMYDYSRQFFDRYYRPEYTTILVVGDVNPKQTQALVAKYWSDWKHGSYKPEIPAEPKQNAARTGHVDWPAQTLPWLDVAFKTPAFTDTQKDSAALDILSFLGFSSNSDLYQKLVIQEQKVDVLAADNEDRLDPFLFQVYARVKKADDIKTVEEQILNTLNGFKDTLVSADKLTAVKKRLRYEFALRMDNSEAIASVLANYIGLRRTPEAVNRVYDLYGQVTPEDLRNTARKYFIDSGRTIVTLTGPAK
jgi:zinc protease